MKYAVPLLVSILFAGCIDSELNKNLSYSYVGDVDGCAVYKAKVSGAPPQLLMKCPPACSYKNQ